MGSVDLMLPDQTLPRSMFAFQMSWVLLGGFEKTKCHFSCGVIIMEDCEDITMEDDHAIKAAFIMEEALQ